MFPCFTIFIFLFQNIRDILLIGHRQAVAWLDEWHGQSDTRTPSQHKRTPQNGSPALLLAQRACSVINGLESAPAGLSMEEVREYERTMQEKTNCKVKSSQNAGEAANNFKKSSKKRKLTL